MAHRIDSAGMNLLLDFHYSDFAEPVHDIAFSLPNNLVKRGLHWEPLGWRGGWFDKEGNVNDKILVYDGLSAKYLTITK